MTDRYDGAGGLRIGDAERDRAATALGEHFAAGRLDSEEHDERVDAVWAARTRDDLPPLFVDLPGGLPVELRPEPAAGPGPRFGSTKGPGLPSYGATVAPPRRRDGLGRTAAKFALVTLAVLVLAPIVFGIVTSFVPILLIAGLVWFFLAGPGCSGSKRQRSKAHWRW